METEIKIEDLKKLAKKYDQQAIIALCVERDGTVRVVTYGENKLKCDAAGWYGKGLLNYNISKVPFETVFGYGNNGIPKDLNSNDISFLKLNYPNIPVEFYQKLEWNIERKSIHEIHHLHPLAIDVIVESSHGNGFGSFYCDGKSFKTLDEAKAFALKE